MMKKSKHLTLIRLLVIISATCCSCLTAAETVYKTYKLCPASVAVNAGEIINSKIKFECAGDYKLAGWSATMQRQRSPQGFFEKTKLRINKHKKEKRYDSAVLNKLTILPQAMSKGEVDIQLSTTDMIPGDYAVNIRGRFVNGKTASYHVLELHLTVKSAAPSAIIGKHTKPAPLQNLVVPRLSCAGTPGSILNADIPWHDDFRVTGAPTRKVKNPTRVKLFHDNRYIYIGVEAFENEMDKQMLSSPYPKIGRNENIEINFDPTGKKSLLGKVIIDPNGNMLEMFGEDDNTGQEKFKFIPGRSFGAQIISVKRLRDKWTVEVKLPIGSFYDGKTKDAFNVLFNIGRTRHCSEKESSDLVPVNRIGHNTPSCYSKLQLKGFEGKNFLWQLESLAVKNVRQAGKQLNIVSARIINHTGSFRNAMVTIRLMDKHGVVIAEQRRCYSALAKKLTNVQMTIAKEIIGRYYTAIDLHDLQGCLLASQGLELTSDNLSPITIKVTQPLYRNNIYATMPEVKTVKADISLSEPMDKPLIVTLTGPDYSKSVTIAKPQTVNKVEFPFAGTAIGKYTLQAGDVKTVIKKLPYSVGEVWADDKNVTHVDGKPFMPYGAPNIPLDWNVRGINTTITYKHFASTADLKEWLDSVHKAGKKAIFPPYLAPNPPERPFSHTARMAGKVSDKQKALLKELLAVTSKHPAVLGYRIGEEPEGWGHNEDWYFDAIKIIQELDPYHPTMITSYGSTGQRRFAAGCDYLLPDSYPDYFEDGSTKHSRRRTYEDSLCADSLHPFWMMIQSFDWGKRNIKNSPGRPPTYDELREQTFSAFIGNSKGTFFYSYNTWGSFSDQLRIGRNYLAIETASLQDFLLCKTEDVIKVNNPDVIAGLKRNKKVVGIIAVNLGDKAANVTFKSSIPLPESLYVNGEKRSVKVSNNSFSDKIAPHTAVIYIAGEFEKDAVVIEEVRQEIKAANRARFKPGNLMAAGEFTYNQMKDYNKGIIPAGIPRLSCSSYKEHMRAGIATVYFLQDGIVMDDYRAMMVWTPAKDDAKPWVETDFGKTVTVSRSVIYHGDDKSAIKSGSLLADDGSGKFRKIATFSDVKNGVFEITHAPVKVRKLRLQIDKTGTTPMLKEWEVYEK